MKRLLIPAAALAVISSAFVAHRWDRYPSAFEAMVACRKWSATVDGTRCMPDSTLFFTNEWRSGMTPTMLGLKGNTIIRRFKWSNQ